MRLCGKDCEDLRQIRGGAGRGERYPDSWVWEWGGGRRVESFILAQGVCEAGGTSEQTQGENSEHECLGLELKSHNGGDTEVRPFVAGPLNS